MNQEKWDNINLGRIKIYNSYIKIPQDNAASWCDRIKINKNGRPEDERNHSLRMQKHTQHLAISIFCPILMRLKPCGTILRQSIKDEKHLARIINALIYLSTQG